MTCWKPETSASEKASRVAAIQRVADDCLLFVLSNLDDPILRRHHLAGHPSHLWSIDITGDVRALYEIVGGEVVVCQVIGTHSELYG